MKTSNFIIIFLTFFLPATSQAQVNFTVNIPPNIPAGSNFIATFALNAGGNADYTIGNFLCTNCTGTPAPTSGTINASGGTLLITFTAGSSGSVQVSGQATGGHGINECNPCTATSLNVVLPIELATFTAEKSDDNLTVLLSWQTVSELNNAGFGIEQSSDAKEWKEIGFAFGNGTTNEPKNYSFVDEEPNNGINYYRLRQVDLDGRFDYSPVRTVTVSTIETITVSPNPLGCGGVLTVTGFKEGDQLSLQTANGQVFYHTNNSYIPIDLPSGVYFLRIIPAKGEAITKKIIVN